MSPWSYLSRANAQPRSYPVLMEPALSSSLAWKRALCFLAIPLPLLALGLHFRQGVLGLLLMPLGFWPFPFRCRLEADGVCVSWFIVSERLPWEEVMSVELREDRRWGVIGRRGSFLSIERKGGSRMILRGKVPALTYLASEIGMRVQRVAETRD